MTGSTSSLDPSPAESRPSPSPDNPADTPRNGAVSLGPRASSALRWGFPFALSAFVILSMIGRRGQYSDDYIFGLRDPATGDPSWPASIFDLVDHFGRPLHLMLTPILQTLFWNHQWVYHLINGGVHLLIGAGLYRLARSFGLDWRAAIGGCSVFLFFPYHHEVIFWSTSLVIAIAAALLVALLLVFRRFARRPKGAWWLVPAMAALAFAIPCFYEQPAGALIVLPFIYLASRPAAQRLKTSILRLGIAGSSMMFAVLLYAFLKISTAPANVRGTSDSLTPIDHLPQRFGELAEILWRWLTAHTPRIAGAAIEHSLEAVATPYLLVPLIALLGLGGIWSLVWLTRSDPGSGSNPEDPHSQAESAGLSTISLVILSGLAVAAGSWLPYAVIESAGVAPRSWYIVSVGLGLALAGLIQLVLSISRRPAWTLIARAATCLVVTPIIVGGSLAQIGWADSMRLVSKADREQSQALANSIADVPPWTVFIPLQNQFRPTSTGLSIYDAALKVWTQAPWILNPVLRHALHRSDVNSTYFNPWDPVGAILKPDAEGWISSIPLHRLPKTDPDGTPVPWSSTVPFVVDADGTVRLVERLYIESLIGQDIVVNLPHVRASAAPGAQFMQFVLREWGRVPPIPAGFEAIERWRNSGGQPPRANTRLETGALWGQRQDYFRLDLNPRSPLPQAIATRLPASPTPRRAIFRATIPPHLTVPLWRTGPQLLSFRLEGQAEPLATLEIGADRIEREKRWLPVVVVIPPMDEPGRLIVELSDTEPGGPPVPIFLTRGIIEIPPEQTPAGG